MQKRPTNAPNNDWLPYLDGLRGIAATTVLISHLAILNGLGRTFLAQGSLAVDLFMMLSGFLMTFHYYAREAREPWENSKTWIRFWTRRFFRISPLYYVLLITALIAGPVIGAWRMDIGIVHPGTMSAIERYTDQSLTNLFMHLSYVFGLVPEYSFRTTLPDWSIALEMQFYAVFPFLMLLWRKIGPLVACVLLVLSCLAFSMVFEDYVRAFPMPAFLGLKLHIFLAGALLAYAYLFKHHRWLALGLALALPCLGMPLEKGGWIQIVKQTVVLAVFAAIVFNVAISQYRIVGMPSRIANRVLLSGPFRFMGDISYSVYLVHLLILIPIIGFLHTFQDFTALKGSFQFVLSSLICIPITFIVSLGLYHYVEKPGVALGKWILNGPPPKPADA